MDTDKSLPGLNEPLDGSLLFIIQNIPSGIQENNYINLFKSVIIKDAGVFLPINIKCVPVAQFTDSIHAFINAYMMKTIGLGKQ